MYEGFERFDKPKVVAVAKKLTLLWAGDELGHSFTLGG